LSAIFNEFFFQPVFNILVYIYNVIPGNDFGLAILVLTLFIRVIFFPLTVKSVLSQRGLAKLQPKIKEIQDKYKGNQQQIGAATMALYKEHKINPLSGCLPLLIQLPVLFALFKALDVAFEPDSLNMIYGFVGNPGIINNVSFGFLDLADKNRILAISAGALQWLQSKVTNKNQGPSQDKSSPTAMMTKQMLYFFPFMVIIISWNFQAGLVLYWVATTAFAIVEQLIIGKRFAENKNNE